MLKSHTGETGRIVISSNNILLTILSNVRGQPGGTQSKVFGPQHTRGPRVLLGEAVEVGGLWSSQTGGKRGEGRGRL